VDAIIVVVDSIVVVMDFISVVGDAVVEVIDVVVKIDKVFSESFESYHKFSFFMESLFVLGLIPDCVPFIEVINLMPEVSSWDVSVLVIFWVMIVDYWLVVDGVVVRVVIGVVVGVGVLAVTIMEVRVVVVVVMVIMAVVMIIVVIVVSSIVVIVIILRPERI
jgi:hypothetical protein